MQQLQTATREDEELEMVIQTVQKGWPDTQSQVADKIKQYRTFREELSHSDELLFKCSKRIVPHRLRNEMLEFKCMNHTWGLSNVKNAPEMHCGGRMCHMQHIQKQQSKRASHVSSST